MTEARRHSVDIPLSRTLVALRRVRSLRDPDTSSLSKIAALVDNMNLETSSYHGAILELRSGNKHSFRRKGACPSQGRNADSGAESESDCDPLSPDASAKCPANKKRVRGARGGNMYRSFNSKWVPSCASHLEKIEHVEMIRSASSKQSRFETQRRPSSSASSEEDEVMCNAGISSTRAAERSSAICRKSLDPATAKFNFVYPNNSRCGVSCCWSRVPKYDDLKFPSHVEGRAFEPTSHAGKELVYHGSAPFQELMSLSEKYRPKSFDELVGQSEVAQSILVAMSRGKISPVYLFHGPRGTGKTSAARIFAAALNCDSCKQHRPCGSCQDCILVLSGRSRVVTELDATEANQKEWSEVLSESVPTHFSSCYKVFIIDECQLLQKNVWSAICKTVEELSRHAVFIMITPDLDKLPGGIVSLCQRYQFVKVKNDDVIGRLRRICIEEQLEFEENALILLASEAGGSLRNAITTLDQLALLGKRITTSLAYELMGVASDDDLLDLLHSSLSSDTSGTVRRARELMSSGIDPIQLTSQLAKLITDILSGGCQSGSSRLVAVAGTDKLRHALQVLLETAKQLRTSKDQSTWLTAALLQFNTGESLSPANANAPQGDSFSRDGQLTITSPKEILKTSTLCNRQNSNSEVHYGARELENIWKKTIENCEPSSLRSFLRKAGKLSSVHVHQGLAVADVQFSDPDHAFRAEQAWDSIVGSLQTVLGCNVDIRTSLLPASTTRTSRKKSSFSLFCCSGGKQQTSASIIKNQNHSLPAVREEKHVEQSPSHQREDPCVTANRSDACSLIEGTTSCRTMLEDLAKGCSEGAYPPKKVCKHGRYMNVQEAKDQPSCFPFLKFSRKSFSTNASHAIYPRIQQNGKRTEESIGVNDPKIFCSNSNEGATHVTEGGKGLLEVCVE